MARTVALVTDSTADLATRSDLPAGRVGVVPLHVRIDGRSFREGEDLDGSRLAAALASRSTVSTASPGPADFETVWWEALQAGAREVVSVHLSGRLSSTVEVARATAARTGLPVHVVDSRSVSGGLAAAVLAGERAAAAGADGAAVVDLVERTARDTQVRFVVESLDQLRRGGRIGAAQAFVGTALAVKPLLQVTRDGGVDGWQKVRTLRAARQALVDWGQDSAADVADAVVDSIREGEFDEGSGVAVDVSIHHLDRPEVAEAMAAELRAVGDEVAVELCELGAVVGAHTGVGTVGIVVSPRVPGDPGRWALED